MALGSLLKDQEKLFDGKNSTSKISCYCPFKPIVYRWQDFTEASCHEVFPISVYCDTTTSLTVRAHIAKKIFYSLVGEIFCGIV